MRNEINRVFISYRREDSRWFARALKNKLTTAIGEDRVFMDVDSIDPGVDFVDVIDEMVAKVDVMIAIIGPEFLTATDENGKRLIDNPQNWVRLEIATALRRKIRVIPLLQQGAELPAVDDLPEDMKQLARRNAIPVGELTFEADVNRIILSLRRLWGESETDRDEEAQPEAVAVSRPPVETTSSPVERASLATGSRSKSPAANATSKKTPALLISVLGLVAVAVTVLWMAGVFSNTNDKNDASISPNPIKQNTGDGKEPEESNETVSSDDALIPESPDSGSALAEKADESDSSPVAAESAISKPAEAAEIAGMIWIRAGKFQMGSPDNEQGRNPDETLHEVELTKGFYIGKYEITQQQYQQIMGTDRSTSRNPNGPTTNVTWKDAVEFCARLTELDNFPEGLKIGKNPPGFKFTLPTEAQWEYACRAGRINNNENRISERELEKMAVSYVRNSNGYDKPEVVGSKLPNEWGIFDMLGNVSEWCLDRYGPYPDGPVTDPAGAADVASNKTRVTRGGYYLSSNVTDKHACRAAVREQFTETGSAGYVGFRVVLVEKGQ